jgi:hypothetical protein
MFFFSYHRETNPAPIFSLHSSSNVYMLIYSRAQDYQADQGSAPNDAITSIVEDVNREQAIKVEEFRRR